MFGMEQPGGWTSDKVHYSINHKSVYECLGSRTHGLLVFVQPGLKIRHPGGILITCLNQLSWLLSTRTSSGFYSLLISELLTSRYWAEVLSSKRNMIRLLRDSSFQVVQRWRSCSSLLHHRQLQSLSQRGAQEHWNQSRGMDEMDL